MKTRTITTQKELLDSIARGTVDPSDAVKKYPKNLSIIQAAYKKDPSSIKFAHIDSINKLGAAKLIAIEHVLSAFSKTMPTNDEIGAIELQALSAWDQEDWTTVGNICKKFWFERPNLPDYQATVETLANAQNWAGLYEFERSYITEPYSVTVGPLEKKKETKDLEDLFRKMMTGDDFSVQTIDGEDHFVFADGSKFNWTKIRVEAEPQNVELEETDFAAYKEFMQQDNLCTLNRSFIDDNGEQCYTNAAGDPIPTFDKDTKGNQYYTNSYPYENFHLALMSSLPDNEIKKAVKGNIYLSKDGKYVVHNYEGKIFSGTIDTKKINLNDLQIDISRDSFKDRIGEELSKAGHIPNDETKYYIDPNTQEQYYLDQKTKEKVPVIDPPLYFETDYRRHLYTDPISNRQLPRPDTPIRFEEMQAINVYTSQFYREINGLMRDEQHRFDYRTGDKIVLRHALVHAVMAHSGLRKVPITDVKAAYRVADYDNDKEQQKRIQMAVNKGVFRIDGFVSSSIEEPASTSASLFITYVIHNLRGAYIAPISQHKNEKEYLASATLLRVENYALVGNTHTFETSMASDLAYKRTETFEPMVIPEPVVAPKYEALNRKIFKILNAYQNSGKPNEKLIQELFNTVNKSSATQSEETKYLIDHIQKDEERCSAFGIDYSKSETAKTADIQELIRRADNHEALFDTQVGPKTQ